MDYRIALQELGIQQLKLSAATEPITAEKDPYKIIQVHDYKSISFLRQNTNVKAASTEVIKQFALAYPELLKVSSFDFRTRKYLFPRGAHVKVKDSLIRRLMCVTLLMFPPPPPPSSTTDP